MYVCPRGPGPGAVLIVGPCIERGDDEPHGHLDDSHEHETEVARGGEAGGRVGEVGAEDHAPAEEVQEREAGVDEGKSGDDERREGLQADGSRGDVEVRSATDDFDNVEAVPLDDVVCRRY